MKMKTIKRKTKNCKICNKLFVPKHVKSPGLYCSYKCNGLANKKESIIREGYIYLLLPEHPHTTKQGYIAEHRYIMEWKLCRLLKPNEIVHHINHKRNDNRIKNLLLMNNSLHRSLHVKNLKRNKNGVFI